MRLNKIDKFRGEYAFLSNFSSAELFYEGLIFPTSEHAYQAAKFSDPKRRLAIAQMRSPADAKKYANTFQNEHRVDFHEMKIAIMHDIVLAKFTQNKNLQESLQKTVGCEIIEGNTWGDTFWGVCDGRGHNHLGKILMEIRDMFHSE